MRNKYITLGAIACIFIGIVMATATYVQADGKIGVLFTSNGLVYTYDKSKQINERQAFDNLEDINIHVEGLEVQVKEIEGNKFTVSYEYFGDPGAIQIKQQDKKLSIISDYQLQGTVGISFGIDEPTMKHNIEIGVPKGKALRNLTLTNEKVSQEEAWLTNTIEGVRIENNLTIKGLNKGLNISGVRAKNLHVENIFTKIDGSTIENIIAKGSMGHNSLELYGTTATNIKLKNMRDVALNGSSINGLLDMEQERLDNLSMADSTIRNIVQAESINMFSAENTTIQDEICINEGTNISITGSKMNSLTGAYKEINGNFNMNRSEVNGLVNFLGNAGSIDIYDTSMQALKIEKAENLTLEKIKAASLKVSEQIGDLHLEKSEVEELFIPKGNAVNLDRTKVDKKATIQVEGWVDVKESTLRNFDLYSASENIDIEGGTLESGVLKAYDTITTKAQLKNNIEAYANNVNIAYNNAAKVMNYELNSESGEIRIDGKSFGKHFIEKDEEKQDTLKVTAKDEITVSKTTLHMSTYEN